MEYKRQKVYIDSTNLSALHGMLDRYSYVSVRYDLIDRTTFIKSLSPFPKAWLTASWGRSNLILIKENYVKDARKNITINPEILNHEIDSVGSTIEEWYDYLCLPFHENTMDSESEQAIRRAKHVIAEKFLATAKTELDKCYESCNTVKKRNKKDDRRQIVISVIGTVLFFSLPFWSIIKEGFTSAEVLAVRIYEESRYGFNGAICRDGWTSHSRGRGTCSHHGGVGYFISRDDHRLTREQAFVEARKRSWID